MTERKGSSEFDPRDIPRPTGMDHEGNMVPPTDSAQPNPYYIHREPGVYPVEVGEVQRVVEDTRGRQVKKRDESLLGRLRRANPTLSSPTYRRLKGLMSQEEYERILDEKRKGHNKKPLGDERSKPNPIIKRK